MIYGRPLTPGEAHLLEEDLEFDEEYLYLDDDFGYDSFLEFDDGSGNTGEEEDDEEVEDMDDENGDDGSAAGGGEDDEPDEADAGEDDEIEAMEDQDPDTLDGGGADPEDPDEEVDDMDGAEPDMASEEPDDTAEDDFEGMDDTGDDGVDPAADGNEGGEGGDDDLDDGGMDEDEDIDDMDAGDGEGEGVGGGDGADDGSGDSSGDGSGLDGGSAPDPNAAVKELERQIYDTLSEEEKAQQKKNLKSQFISIVTSADEIINSISDAPKTDITLKPLDTCTNSLVRIKAMVRDYVDNLYDSRDYTTNLTNFERFLAALAGVRQLLDITVDLKNKEEKKNA